MIAPATFRFNAETHEYRDDVGVLPSITQMLERAGLIDDRWYTEESSTRGTAVHLLTAHYDLGALDVESLVSAHRGYLLAHIKAVQVSQVVMEDVEVAKKHRTLRFAGRPDRTMRLHKARGVWEIKSGDFAKSHQIQTALQAILAADGDPLPPWAWVRYCCYIGENGRAKVEQHRNRADFDKAYDIIREFAA